MLQTVEFQNVELQNVELQNVELQNVKLQNVELQNVELQNVEFQNVEFQNVEWIKGRITEYRKLKKRRKLQNDGIQNVKKIGHIGQYMKTIYFIYYTATN